MALLIGGSLGLAALSLLVPAMPGADPWAWIVWGREVAELDLDTTEGPSWKPLPVAFTTVFSLFGGAAPELWLVVARAGGIAAFGLAFLLARRLAAGARPPLAIAGGVVAALALLLLPDWLKYLAQGSSEPLAVALILGAVLRHLDERPGQALALGFLVALARPEAWPFFGAYAFFVARRDRSLRLPALGAGLTVALLWFVPDWIGSGDPLYGARRARARSGGEDLGGETLSRALDAAADLVLLPLLAAAVWAVVVAWRRRERVTLLLGAVSFPWVAAVVVMAAVGYAGNSRYMIPAAALISVLAGVGLAHALAAMPGPVARHVLAALMLVLAVPFAIPRVDDARDQADRVRLEDRLEDDLPEAIRAAGGHDAVLERGAPVANGWPAAPGMDRPLAWHLELPLSEVDLLRGSGTRSLRPVRKPVVVFSPQHRAPARSQGLFSVQVLARTAHWDVAAVEPRR